MIDQGRGPGLYTWEKFPWWFWCESLAKNCQSSTFQFKMLHCLRSWDVGIGKRYYRDFKPHRSRWFPSCVEGSWGKSCLLFPRRLFLSQKQTPTPDGVLSFKAKGGGFLGLEGGPLKSEVSQMDNRWVGWDCAARELWRQLSPCGGTLAAGSARGSAPVNGNALHACAEFWPPGLALLCGLELRKARVTRRFCARRLRRLDQHVSKAPHQVMLGCANTSKMGKNTRTFTFGILLGKFGPVSLKRTKNFNQV